jgi:hypothetical protein
MLKVNQLILVIIATILMGCSHNTPKKEPNVIMQCLMVAESGNAGFIWYVKVPQEPIWTTFSKIILRCNQQTKQMCIIKDCTTVNELPDEETLNLLKKEMQEKQNEESKIYT